MNIGEEQLINEKSGEDVDLSEVSEEYEDGAPEQVAKKLNEEVKKIKTQTPPSKEEIRNFRVSTILKGRKRLENEDFTVYKNRVKFENKITKIYLRGRVYEQNSM